MSPYYPAAVANEFLDRSSKSGLLLTPMQLLKLVYISHGWTLAVTGKPLIREPVQAWKFGPVIPSLFHEFKVFGGNPIQRLAHYAELADCDETGESELVVSAPFLPKSDENSIKLIDWVWKVYGSKEGWELSRMTHEKGTPWSKAVDEMKAKHGDWVSGVTIPDDSIRNHYVEIWKTKYAG